MKRLIVEISEGNEKKKMCPYYIFPSTQRLIKLTRDIHQFKTMDEMFNTIMMDYNTRREVDIPSAYSQDIPIAIASDPDREMNRRKRKTGKSLDPDRRKVFEVGNDEIP